MSLLFSECLQQSHCVCLFIGEPPCKTDVWRKEMIEKLSSTLEKPVDDWETQYVSLLQRHRALVSQLTKSRDPWLPEEITDELKLYAFLFLLHH